MSFATWLTFVLVCSITALSPGSGAVLSMSHGLAYGLRRASATVLGLQLGLLTLFLVGGLGVGSILVASELAFKLVKTIGALYLIYLGWSQWRAPVQADAAAQVLPETSAKKRVLTGFLTNATNPKGVIFMVAILPQFIDHEQGLLPQLALIGATMVVIDTVVMHGYALLAASMQRFFRDARSLKAQNRFFGGILMAVGSALFFLKRNPA